MIATGGVGPAIRKKHGPSITPIQRRSADDGFHNESLAQMHNEIVDITNNLIDFTTAPSQMESISSLSSDSELKEFFEKARKLSLLTSMPLPPIEFGFEERLRIVQACLNATYEFLNTPAIKKQVSATRGEGGYSLLLSDLEKMKTEMEGNFLL